MKMKRFELNFNEDKINDIFNKYGASYDLKECCNLLNKLNDECKFLADQRDYWKQKYEEGTETFTLKCYDSKEDFIDGEVLPNCPLKPLINENEQLKQQIEIEKKRQLEKDMYYVKIKEENKQLRTQLLICQQSKNDDGRFKI